MIKINGISEQTGISPYKLRRVLNDYALGVCTDEELNSLIEIFEKKASDLKDLAEKQKSRNNA